MVPMNRPGERGDRRRGGTAVPRTAVLGWLLALVAMLFCCSPTGVPAAHHEAAAVRVHTPSPAAAVTADAPGERGAGSSCHGTTDRSTSAVLPGPTAPAPLTCTTTSAAPEAPLSGATGIRGPSHDGAGAVDRLRLQVQRV
ncbi:hypothetical protein B9S64_29575 [Streptomyces sp. SM18]|nr:hypothetical protein B9S64_29575 [Streptomyces sp. SM18]